MTLTDELENIDDIETFLDFVRALIDGWETNEKEGKFQGFDKFTSSTTDWQNGTVVSYLEATHSWAKSTKMGDKRGVASSLSWKAFALFLCMGKIYE